MSTPKEYTPFGPEWKKEVMRLTKAQIVEILRTALMELQTALEKEAGK
jgi:hypothetical protein